LNQLRLTIQIHLVYMLVMHSISILTHNSFNIHLPILVSNHQGDFQEGNIQKKKKINSRTWLLLNLTRFSTTPLVGD
jgi:hypothetical protein